MEYAGTFWAISGGENEGEKRRNGLAMVWSEHTRKQFVFGMANIHSGRKVYCLLQPTVNICLFLCRHTGKRLATQDCFLLLFCRQWEKKLSSWFLAPDQIGMVRSYLNEVRRNVFWISSINIIKCTTRYFLDCMSHSINLTPKNSFNAQFSG